VKTILLIGKNGQVGWELQNTLLPYGNLVALDRTQLDLTQADDIRRTIREVSPAIIVNAAGYTTVDKAEEEAALAMMVNATAPGVLAEEASRLDALLVHYSTDYVFDGTRLAPYVEEDEANPVNVYGKTKLAGEQAIRATGCKHLILRASWIYSARGTNFVLTMLRLGRARKEIAVVSDQIGSPTSARELAKTTAELLEKVIRPHEQSGLYHLSASGYASRFEFAKKIIDTAKMLSGNPSEWADIVATTTENYPLPAARPLNAATSKEKIKRIFDVKMPSWDSQLDFFMRDSSDGECRG
jgi:dTDP-4-dehydrorhamnose reductase